MSVNLTNAGLLLVAIVAVLSRDATAQECAPPDTSKCTSCTTLDKCDVCANSGEGPLTPTSAAECSACAANCQFCDVRGAKQCDDFSCDEGYALNKITNICEPCAPGCLACSIVGPGLCETATCTPKTGLRLGQGSAPGDCTPCSPLNCDQCFSNNGICEKCATGFDLDGTKTICAKALAGAVAPPAPSGSCSIANCQTCAGNQCTQCNDGFGPPRKGDASSCLPCRGHGKDHLKHEETGDC